MMVFELRRAVGLMVLKWKGNCGKRTKFGKPIKKRVAEIAGGQIKMLGIISGNKIVAEEEKS
jgi:hypothetical protein